MNVAGKTVKYEIMNDIFHDPIMSLNQGLATFLCKGPDSNIFVSVGHIVSFIPT